jgi:hypothetical protein
MGADTATNILPSAGPTGCAHYKILKSKNKNYINGT